MKQQATFNRVTGSKYRPFVAKVYGSLRGVPFQQAFKSVEAAQRVANTHNGFVVSLIH